MPENQDAEVQVEGEALVTISYNDDDDGGGYLASHCVCVIVLAVVMLRYLHLPSHNGKTIVRERHNDSAAAG